MNRVEGKVAIVTGSTSGLGRAEAVMLAREGAKVAVTGRNDERGAEVVEEIRAFGGVAEYWRVDVSKEEECIKLIKEVVEKFGKLDILVNNAGITGPDVPTDKVEEADWDNMFNINVKSVLFMTKHAIPEFRKNGKGSIVNTSSVSGLIGDRELTPYHATKACVKMMTQKDAIEYAPENIRVNCVCPGTVMTPLVKGLLADDPHYLDNDIKRYPCGYFGEPDDVAYGVLFLASDEGRFVTGHALVIDGGYTAQ
ncbi:MAG: SDR family oxidoreductase [Eubacteriaceae bacterium]|nr:SDR family oxidoreductase [Eubacteriaceae bacterium]